MKATFRNRHLFGGFWDNANYFFDIISTVMNETEDNEYRPTSKDILKAGVDQQGSGTGLFILMFTTCNDQRVYLH